MNRGTPNQRPTRPLSAEEIDKACITIEHTIDMLVGQDLYYHERIRRILERAGFGVRRLEREPHHPVWVGSIRPGNTNLSLDKREASRQLRRILTQAGLKIKAGELTVFDRRKEMIRFTFLFQWGCPGDLSQLPAH